jgi:hypothetical protein
VCAALVSAVALVSAGGCFWEQSTANPADATGEASGNRGGREVAADFHSGGTAVPVRNPAIPAGTPSFRFGNLDYVLVNSNDLVNQYIPFGQTLENWTTMFALRKFPDTLSPETAVNNVTQTLAREHPQTKYKVTQDPGTGDQAVDFFIWTQDKQLSEFDVHIYQQQRPSGVLGKMFMMRGYGQQGHMDLLKQIVNQKDALTQAVFEFSFPVFIVPKP